MLEKLAEVDNRFTELDRLLADPEVAMDYEKIVEYSKERSNLEELVTKYREFKRMNDELDDAKMMRDEEEDPELRDMAKEEITSLEAEIDALGEELKMMLLPKDPRDEKNVIIEIRGGAGGDEAALFAADLFRMYVRYAESQRYKVEVTAENETGGGGYKRVEFEVKGKGAFSRFKYEGGTHRVQRVPATESQGRVHTSTVTVAIMAEMEDVDIELDMNDVRVDVFRSQGAGGQSVNTTDSAVRMTHIPSGLVVEMQDERSQLQNRLRAKQRLLNKLYEMEVEKQRSEQEAERRDQVGTGDRAEKIRTYNYSQNRVTDHRINLSNYNLPAVMDGDLDEFIDELATRAEAEKLSMG